MSRRVGGVGGCRVCLMNLGDRGDSWMGDVVWNSIGENPRWIKVSASAIRFDDEQEGQTTVASPYNQRSLVYQD